MMCFKLSRRPPFCVSVVWLFLGWGLLIGELCVVELAVGWMVVDGKEKGKKKERVGMCCVCGIYECRYQDFCFSTLLLSVSVPSFNLLFLFPLFLFLE